MPTNDLAKANTRLERDRSKQLKKLSKAQRKGLKQEKRLISSVHGNAAATGQDPSFSPSEAAVTGGQGGGSLLRGFEELGVKKEKTKRHRRFDRYRRHKKKRGDTVGPNDLDSSELTRLAQLDEDEQLLALMSGSSPFTPQRSRGSGRGGVRGAGGGNSSSDFSEESLGSEFSVDDDDDDSWESSDSGSVASDDLPEGATKEEPNGGDRTSKPQKKRRRDRALGGDVLSKSADAEALTRAVVESEQPEPALKAVFEGGMEDAVFSKLDAFVRSQEHEIEDICSSYHEQFVTAVDGLLGMRDEVDGLREDISKINKDAQESGARLAASLAEAERARAMRANIATATVAVRECLAIAVPVQQAQDLLANGQRLAAYRTVQRLQLELLPAFRSKSTLATVAPDVTTANGPNARKEDGAFISHLSSMVDELQAKIEDSVTRDFNDWLFELREKTYEVGSFAMRHQRVQMRAEHGVIQDSEKAKSEQQLQDMFDNDYWYQHRASVTPLYESLHIYFAVGGDRLEQFRNAYLDSRRTQLGLILHPSSTVPVLKQSETWGSDSESSDSGSSDEGTASSKKRRASSNLQDDDDDDATIPRATEQLIVTLAGFFVSEHRVARTARISTATQVSSGQSSKNPSSSASDWFLSPTAMVDGMWQLAARTVRTTMLDSVAQVRSGRALTELKRFWAIFLSTMQRFGYDLRPLMDIMPRLSSGFGELIIARGVIALSGMLERSLEADREDVEFWGPLLVKTESEYDELIAANGLTERALVAACDADVDKDEESSGSDSDGDENFDDKTDTGNLPGFAERPKLPLVCDFSMLVPRYGQLIQEIIDDYFDFTQGLTTQAHSQPRHEIVRQATEKAIVSLNTTYTGWLQSLAVSVRPDGQETTVSVLLVLARSWVNFGALLDTREQWQMLLASRTAPAGRFGQPATLNGIILSQSATNFPEHQRQLEGVMSTAVRRFVSNSLEKSHPRRRWGEDSKTAKRSSKNESDTADASAVENAAAQLDNVLSPSAVQSADLSDVASYVRASSVAQPFASELAEYLRSEMFSALRLLPPSVSLTIQQRALTSVADTVLDEVYRCTKVTPLGLSQLSCDVAALELVVRQHAIVSDGFAPPVSMLGEMREIVRLTRACAAASTLTQEFRDERMRKREFPLLAKNTQRWQRLAAFVDACRSGFGSSKSKGKSFFRRSTTPTAGLDELLTFLKGQRGSSLPE